MKRVAAAWGAAAAAAVATVAHLAYWYVPRERTGVPRAPEARRLLVEPGWDAAVWIPYPHQNLGVLERRVGDLRAWIDLVAGREARPLPSFGPFAVPPSFEMAAAWRRADGRSAAALRVYPSVALLAKASGKLARNPWLAGGRVPLGGGRSGNVTWRGSVWRLDVEAGQQAGEVPPLSLAAAPGESPPLALVRLDAPVERLPAGLYRCVRGGQGLELRAGAPAAAERPPVLAGSDPPAAWLVERPTRRRAAALLLWEREGPVPPFPAAATLRRGEITAPRLPGAELLRLVGRKPLSRWAGAFEARALDEGDLALAAALAPELARELGERPRLALWAGVDPVRLAAVADRLARRFGDLPLGALLGVDPGALARRLAAFEGCGTSVLEVEREPVAARWWLCPPRREERDEPPRSAPNR